MVLPHSGYRKLKLTRVAKASLDELLEDVHDWLTAHGEEEWAVRRLAAGVRRG